MLDYNPFIHPLELPVQKLLVYCMTDRPLFLPPRQGSTPGTTLAGAFGNALWPTLCPNHNSPTGACNIIKPNNPVCQNPDECVVSWLYKPYSTVHHRNFARPILLRASELEGDKPVEAFTLEVTLWGRHAIANQEAVIDTLKTMGKRGINSEGKPVHFGMTKIETGPSLTLIERVKRMPPIQSVLLEFQTPFLHQEKTEEGKRYFHTQPQLPLISILGNVAYNLAAWDMEDRELGEQFDKTQRHGLARDARDMAFDAAEKLFILRTHLSPVEIGERYSRGTKKNMLLQGFIGLAELAGDFEVAMPWLLTLALAGGGQKRAMGFGSVRMWLNS
jgi:hypothetical protein